MSKRSEIRSLIRGEVIKIATQVAKEGKPTEANIGAAWGRLEVEFQRRYQLEFNKETADLPTLMLALATAKYMEKAGWVNINWGDKNGGGESGGGDNV